MEAFFEMYFLISLIRHLWQLLTRVGYYFPVTCCYFIHCVQHTAQFFQFFVRRTLSPQSNDTFSLLRTDMFASHDENLGLF